MTQMDVSRPWDKDETIHFGCQEAKSQGHTRPKIDLETLRMYHSRPHWAE